jgi:hypothetical protein
MQVTSGHRISPEDRKVVSTLLVSPKEKTPSITIMCEAATPGLNISRWDVKTLDIYCEQVNCKTHIYRIHFFSDAPETRILLGGSLNESSIKEGSDVYFECL